MGKRYFGGTLLWRGVTLEELYFGGTLLWGSVTLGKRYFGERYVREALLWGRYVREALLWGRYVREAFLLGSVTLGKRYFGEALRLGIKGRNTTFITLRHLTTSFLVSFYLLLKRPCFDTYNGRFSELSLSSLNKGDRPHITT